MTRFQGVAASVLLVTLAVFGPAGLAWGHASMVKSSPAAGAALSQPPSEIRAWFSEELAVKGSALRLYDAHSKLLATGGVDLKVSKHDQMRVASSHLTAGAYVVRWHAISADDNEPRDGSFQFSIKAPAAHAPSGTMAMSLPPLQVIAPANHATVKNPVALTISTPADMTKYTMGGMGSMGGTGSVQGMSAGVHLHIDVDGTTLMPSKDQLTAAGSQQYRYTLPHLAAGPHTAKVYWADNKTHAAQGPIHTVAFTCSG